MLIQQRQLGLLNKLLKDYVLKKDIATLTKYQASIVIEGMLNEGRVKCEINGVKLSDADVNKKQQLFNSIVQPKMATEKQFKYISDLASISHYKIVTKNIKQKDVQSLIAFLRNGENSSVAINYLKKINLNELIKIKKDDSSPSETNLPDDWVFQSTEINGYIDF